MSSDLIAIIYQKIKNFYDPVSNKAFDSKNNDLIITCKDGHANITININPDKKALYSDLSKKLKDNLKNIPHLLSINIILTSENITKTPNDNRNKFINPAKK